MDFNNDILMQAFYEQFCESANMFYENVIDAEEFHNIYGNLAENIGVYVLAQFERARRDNVETIG